MVYFIIVVIGLAIILSIYERKTWREIYTATGDNVGKAQTVYNTLKSHGIKCKTKTKSFAGTGRGPKMSHRTATMIVLVHKQDEAKAFSVFSDMNI